MTYAIGMAIVPVVGGAIVQNTVGDGFVAP